MFTKYIFDMKLLFRQNDNRVMLILIIVYLHRLFVYVWLLSISDFVVMSIDIFWRYSTEKELNRSPDEMEKEIGEGDQKSLQDL